MTFGNLLRFAGAGAVCFFLAACGGLDTRTLVTSDFAYAPAHPAHASTPDDDSTLFPDDESDNGPARVGGPRVQCVPYARAHSSVDIHGDAYTWWDKADGVYARSLDPVEGSIMVLKNYAGKHHAHVAIVRRMLSPREIRIDHANWLNDGAIYVNDPVLDVSPDNDWTEVKVWNIRSGTWGTRVYAVQGFIGPGAPDSNPVVASYRGPAGDPIARLIAASATTAAYPAAPRFKHSQLDH